MFKVKDEVVYPGHGVAIIEEIVEKKVGSTKKSFFKLRFKYKSISILVPQERFEHSGVRFVGESDEVLRVIDRLSSRELGEAINPDAMPVGWSKKQKEYQIRIESGDLQDIATIYRELRMCAEKKILSFGEKGLLETAEDLLSQEVLAATSLDKDKILEKIRSPFKGEVSP